MEIHVQEPGAGWSNGDIEPQLYASSQAGKLRLYSTQRRWIGLQSGWTRIGGEGKTELDVLHSTSAGTGISLVTTDEEQAHVVRCLIAQLCEKLFSLGWATGTSGAVSIRVRRSSAPGSGNNWRVFVTPSGVQKEDMIGDDIFEMDMNEKIIVPSKTNGLRLSACTCLWFIVYKHRPSATCVIHTHSINAVMATMLDTSECSSSLKITHLEMLKGVGNHANDDVLEIPIIDNRASEDLLAAQFEEAIKLYPKCNAVLVRRHGLFVWGDSWEQAKTQCESFDYVFECAVKMFQMGINPGKPPATLTPSEGAETNKRRKFENAFNGVSATENTDDVSSNPAPLLPRDSTKFDAIVLDIEGCTTSISFVTEVLFPYVRRNLNAYCKVLKDNDPPKFIQYLESLRKEVNEASNGDGITSDVIEPFVEYLMDRDVKSATLKDLQGKMWKAGYDSGELKGHVYPDTTAMMRWMKSNDVPVYIYSSGSVNAQKLLFGTSVDGDLLNNIAGHFDITTAGPKKEAASYQNIANTLKTDVSRVVFVSDSEAELFAAKEAGIGAPIMSIRPGNAPLTSAGKEAFASVHSLLQLCG